MNSALLKHDLAFGAPSISTHTGATAQLFPFLGKAGALGQVWLERARQRSELKRMDERMLADIGITRHEAFREAGKPFWRA